MYLITNFQCLTQEDGIIIFRKYDRHGDILNEEAVVTDSFFDNIGKLNNLRDHNIPVFVEAPIFLVNEDVLKLPFAKSFLGSLADVRVLLLSMGHIPALSVNFSLEGILIELGLTPKKDKNTSLSILVRYLCGLMLNDE